MMKQANKIYLAYGSNLNLPQMAQRCPYAIVIGRTTLEGYELLFRGDNNSAVATVEPKKGGSVPVLLWEITPRDEESLDRYEGFPKLYRKETVTVRFNGKPVGAMIYIMNDGWPLGLPGIAYTNTIVEGYKAAGFDLAALRAAVQVTTRRMPKREKDTM